MFAVVGYLTENKSLIHLFTNIEKILKPGGLFIFDCWFGPSVLSDKPIDKYRLSEENGVRLIRFTHPELHPLKNVIDVNFHVVEIHNGQIQTEVKEMHPMRFFLLQKLSCFLARLDLTLK